MAWLSLLLETYLLGGVVCFFTKKTLNMAFCGILLVSMSDAIVIKDLRKYYGIHRGIENVTLTVKEGDIHGFLGPNGAGKTTTLRILVGLLKPQGGSATIFGEPIGSRKILERIGYLPSDFSLYGHFTVDDYLDFIEAIRGQAPLRDELVERFDVDTTIKTKELSRGNKQKIGIIQALMHDPELIIADEPTTGLDPLMQEEFINLIRDFHKRGKTIFLSSHILSEVQEVCKTVSVIKEGIIISTGRVDELLAKVPRKAVIKFKGHAPVEEVGKVFTKESYKVDGNQVTVFFTSDEFSIIDKIRGLSNVASVLLPEPTLEEYFLPIYSRGKEE